ncbi:MAG: TfoX/Sxy family protein [Myxococcaceae bacterium]
MAYDEVLAECIRGAVSRRGGITEKKMFGGLAFLLNGKMFCGIVKDELMVRVGPDRNAEALKKPHVRPMDFTGRPMKGYVFVAPAGCRTDAAVAAWAKWGAEFVASLDTGAGKKKPPKAAKPPRRAAR